MKLLLKASEEREHFKDLIYKELTFASDFISCDGSISHHKGDKAFISDVIYNSGYYDCIGKWQEPKISMFKINGIPSTCWKPETFIEYQTPTK